MVDCHEIAANESSNYAIPRLKALPYKGANGVSCTCVRNAMARWNQVKGATEQEKIRAKALLIRVARNQCKMDVQWEAKNLGLTGWTIPELLVIHSQAHLNNSKLLHYEAMLCLVDGYGMEPPCGKFKNSQLDECWRDILI